MQRDRMEDKGRRKEDGAEEEERGESDPQSNGGYVSIILLVKLHCSKCAMKVIRFVKRLEGVEEVTVDESNTRLSVTGKAGLDPHELLLKVEAKTRKKVSLLSFDTHEAIDESKDGGRRGTMVVLKVGLHCKGCMERVKERLLGVGRVEGVEMDLERNVVAVRGAMDVERMVEYLEGELRRKVEVVAIMVEEKKEKEEEVVEREEGREGKSMRKEKVAGEEVGEGKSMTSGKVKEGEVGEDESMKREKVKEEGAARREMVNKEAKEKKTEEGDASREGNTKEKKTEDGDVRREGNTREKKVEKEARGDFMEGEHKGRGEEHHYIGSVHGVYLPYGYQIGMGQAPTTFSEENPNACNIM